MNNSGQTIHQLFFNKHDKANAINNLDLIKLIIAFILTVIVILLHYFFRSTLYINLVIMVLTIPVQFFCGWSFIKGGLKSILNKSPNMDLLVATGTLITFIYSVYIMFSGGETYFDTSCLLITFISLGEFIEDRAKNKSNEAIDGLVNLVPKTLRLVLGFKSDIELINAYNNGDDFDLSKGYLESVDVGDYIFINEGESVPADAQIILGEVKIDESMLTGESDLVYKKFNDEIIAGTVIVSGKVVARVIRNLNNSTLAKIIKAVIDSQNSKAPVARAADKIASVFVPVVLVLALITFVLWMLFGYGLLIDKLNQGLMCAVSVLVVSCPCALVLATPITLTVGMGKAAQLGIIIRDASVLENMCKIKNMVFDKTGTLTQSNLDKNVEAAKTLRPDAKATVEQLRKTLGMNTYMISGDRESEAFRIADQIGINRSNVVAEADPISKNDYLNKLMRDVNSNNKDAGLFGYVGDGINDAPAMATADVGITLESATDIALECGDVVLMHNKLLDLIIAFRLSKLSMRKIKQNLFWALFYNIVFIPLAAFGVMLPMWCGVIHAISSLIVVFNALLLKRFK